MRRYNRIIENNTNTQKNGGNTMNNTMNEGKFNSDQAVINYKKFMYNEENAFNCDSCPENHTGEYRGCGQQNCWVCVHCNR